MTDSNEDNSDIHEVLTIESDIMKLCSTLDIIEHHGAPISAVKILCATNLLNTASRIALEALDEGEFGLEADKTKQSIIDTIKEKAAQWSLKVISFFKNKSASFFGKINSLLDKFKKAMSLAKDKISVKANSTKVYVKAHPYKTVAMALSACVAVMGLIAFTGRMLPTVSSSKAMIQFTNTFKNKVAEIRWPFGEVSAKVISGGKKVALAVAAVGAVGGLGKLVQLGWSNVTAEQLDKGLEKVCGGLEKTWMTLAPKVSTIGNTVIDLTKNTFKAGIGGFNIGYNALVNERENRYNVDITEKEILKETAQIGLGGVVAAGTVVLFWASSIIYALYKLMITIVGGTVNLCYRTMQSLSHPVEKEYV